MAKSIVALYNGEERGWEGHRGDKGQRWGRRCALGLAGMPREMLGRDEPCCHPGINQYQGVVETSKGSADSWEALKQILEMGWKMMEVGAEPVGD